MDTEPKPDPSQEGGVRKLWRRWREQPLSGAIGGDLALVALVVVGVVLVGVALAGGSDETAASGSGGGGESGSESAAGADTDQALAFAQCMRENGVPEFPDPVDGGFRLTPDSGVRLGSPEFQEAREACQDEAPPGLPGGRGGTPDPEMEEQVLAFAQCMRDNGINFPDPDMSGGGVVIQPGQDGADFDPDSPEFDAAREACAEHLQGLGPGGAGPGGMRR